MVNKPDILHEAPCFMCKDRHYKCWGECGKFKKYTEDVKDERRKEKEWKKYQR